MCGLFGWKFGSQVPMEKRVIIATVLALENETRGRDSWGVLDLQSKEIIRELGKIGKGVHRFCLLPEALCHTRLATVGAVTLENAHPFEYKHIIGSHNGSVENHWQLNNKMERDFKVDSEHVFAHIADNESKSDVTAHGAITYLDIREAQDGGGLYFGKFNGGTLSVYSVNAPGGEESCMVVWSSTQAAVENALMTAGLDGFAWKIEEGRVYQITDFTVYNTVRKLAFEKPGKRGNGTTAWSNPTMYGGYEECNSAHYNNWIEQTRKNVASDARQKKVQGKLQPLVDNGVVIWKDCCECGRWVRVTKIGLDYVCAMCEEVYLENKRAEELALQTKPHEQLTAVKIQDKTAELCDYCGQVEAVFHVPALEGIVCAACMQVVDSDLFSSYEIQKIKPEIPVIELEEGKDWKECDGAWIWQGTVNA